MLENEISRRRMFQMGLGAAATAGLVSTTGSALSQTSAPTPSNLGLPGNPKALQDSVNGAYAFLTQMMDAYAQGATVRLSQSYADQIAGGQFFSTAFIYDNALLTCAWLARGNINRAMIVGDALLEAQNTDPAADGRFRQAYMAGLPDTNGAFVTTGLSFFQGSAVGDVAWAGIALAQLYARTKLKKYLNGALRAATFIETTTRDNTNVPPGGYFFAMVSRINPLSTTSMCTRSSPCWPISPATTPGSTALHTRRRSSRQCLINPQAISGREQAIQLTFFSTTVRKTFRPGRIWRSKIQILLSRSTG